MLKLLFKIFYGTAVNKTYKNTSREEKALTFLSGFCSVLILSLIIYGGVFLNIQFPSKWLMIIILILIFIIVGYLVKARLKTILDIEQFKLKYEELPKNKKTWMRIIGWALGLFYFVLILHSLITLNEYLF